ncbi:F-box protein pof7 [Escovopsis weberi]|uniref:F-box protein pof7 n=1 Tax=Escovopsis weberi TaxID=150374 RepID=A0A0M9VVW5_ESCWE|nr:F-box protein pof7 [Escovopsis weberi]
MDGSAIQTPQPSSKKQPVSALDHYEEAMEKEAQGNMGESLRLYRKAYRLDHRVDKVYREKHHAQQGAPAKPVVKPSEHSPATPPTPKSPGQQDAAAAVPIGDLIASFASLAVEPAPPIIEGDIPPPCPISNIPDELLIHIMADVATADVADFARLALVCKRFAYLVATEQRIWRRVCLGPEFGFSRMHRAFTHSLDWQALDRPASTSEEEDQQQQQQALSRALVPAVYPSWKAMFRARPRIRFNGCYISTVNYIRSGQQSTNQATWGGPPVLIVTYYRYLRFFRDGTCISLLSTVSPQDVVHHLTRDNVLSHRHAPHAHLPSSFMHQAYRGRWRLSSFPWPDDDSDPSPDAGSSSSSSSSPPESDLRIETEGPAGKYSYRMDLALQSGSRNPSVARNNKIAWKTFSCYSKLTDDWADFHLKNDKPFYFSRVKSYGLGLV